jgi:acylphosphatase
MIESKDMFSTLPGRRCGALDMEQIARHILFIGHVQGVGFRYTAQRIAGRYGLAGYVRNLSDGSVEMLVQGTSEEIDRCLEEIDAEFTGHIHDREVRHVPPSPRYTDFRIAF